MNKIPTTLHEWSSQIDFFEWLKRETPGLYSRIVQMIEEPEADVR